MKSPDHMKDDEEHLGLGAKLVMAGVCVVVVAAIATLAYRNNRPQPEPETTATQPAELKSTTRVNAGSVETHVERDTLALPGGLRVALDKFMQKGTSPTTDNSIVGPLEESLTKDPTNAAAHVMLAEYYRGSDQLDKAIYHYMLASKISPEAPQPWYGLGRCYYSLASFDMVSREKFKQFPNGLVILEPDDCGRDNLLEARRMFERAERSHGELHGVQHESRGSDLKFEAMDIEKELRQVNQDLTEYWTMQGIGFERQDRAPEALDAYKRAVSYSPHSYTANYGLGTAYFLMGKFAESLHAFDATRQIEPDSFDALNNRELARLRQKGINSPDNADGKAMLREDARSSDRKLRLGALILCGDREIIASATARNPKIEEEMQPVMQWKERHSQQADQR